MAKIVIQSVQKALRILDILAFDDPEGHGVPLKKLGEILNQRTTTLHNILKTMIDCNYAAQNQAGLYIAGPKCSDLRQLGQILPGGGFYDMVQKQMIALSEEWGESLVYTSLLNGSRTTLFECKCEHPVKIDDASMKSSDFYSLVTGRVLAAFADSVSLSEIIEKNGFPGESWGGVSDNAELEKRLAEIRENRYAIDFRHGHIVALAVPIRVRPLGALGFYSPMYRCDSDKQNLVLEKLWETAFRLEAFADVRTKINKPKQ